MLDQLSWRCDFKCPATTGRRNRQAHVISRETATTSTPRDRAGASLPWDGRKLYQQIAASVSAAIEAGVYRPGQRIPSERELADEFKVSRPTVREAMIALEVAGTVKSKHGSGIYVADNPPSDVPAPELDIGAFELTEARRLFEGETAALAAAVITDAEIERLDAIVAEMVRENAEDIAGERADRQFHVAIAEATRNSAVVGVIEQLWDARYRSPLCMHTLARARALGDRPRIEEHIAIVDALRSRDPRAARAAMRDHLARVIDGLLDATEVDAVERARSDTVAKRAEFTRRTRI